MAVAKYISMDAEVFFFLELRFNTGRCIYVFICLFINLTSEFKIPGFAFGCAEQFFPGPLTRGYMIQV